MAVAPMTKVQVIIHGAASTEVVRHIYDLGILQAIEVKVETQQAEGLQIQDASDEMNYCLADFEEKLRDVTRALEILSEYDESGRKIIENFITLKQSLPRHVFEEVCQQFDFSGLAAQLQESAETLKHLQEQEKWRQDDLELLETLSDVPFPLGDLRTLMQARSLIGRVRKEARDALREALAPYDDQVYWDEITEQGQFAYLFLMYLPLAASHSNEDVIATLLEQHSFDALELSDYALRIPEEIPRLTQELAQIRTEITAAQAGLRTFVQYTEQFKILEDYLENEIERCKDLQNFAETKQVYFAEGWMKQRDKIRLNEALREFDEMTEIFYADPDPYDETVPVILENNRLIQPFEVITRMFGMPKYGEPDPTIMLAPFFFVFFGLCLTDAGYGILLSLFTFWLMRKYILTEGALRLARLLFYGGISTVIFGALAGGWFGNILDFLPQPLSVVTAAKNALIVVDPIKQPIPFLGIALLLGYIQVCYGIFLKLRNRLRRRDMSTLLEEGIWLVLINGLMGWGIIASTPFGQEDAGQLAIRICQIAALVSAVVRVWFYKRDEKNVVKRVLIGILGLYDITGIFSDVLSYSRLLALGLSTGVIAMLIDMLAQMVSNVPVIGIVIAILLFCVGHVFNTVINVLGGFIHSGRLQFLEFFSKFFEGGGKRYKPFRFESKYFQFTEQT